MLYEEAKWIGNQLNQICSPGMKLLNIGSSSLYSRTISQPHMDEFIFAPLRNNNVEIIHTDIQDVEGVDLVGDFTNPDFVSHLKSMKFDCILCSNLLEHIKNKEPLVLAMEEILPKQRYMVVTVPYIYPYHLDPIDTMYRPAVLELEKIFKNLSLSSGECVIASRTAAGKTEKNYFQMLKNSPKLAIRIVLRSLLPFYKYTIWKHTFNDLKNMFKPFQVTCITLKK